jgi:NitT/TauT family transport system substrate-binding protein
MYLDGGLKPNIREGAFGTLLAMLRSNQVDIALELEPNVSQAVSEGARVLYGLPEVYGEFAITGLTCTPDFLEQKPEMARSVVCAIQQALDYIRLNQDSTLSILAHRFPEIRKGVAKDALTRVIHAGIIPKDARITKSAWMKAITLRKEVGDIKTIKLEKDYIDNSCADWAKSNCSDD